MSGDTDSAKKSAETAKKLYGEDFHKRIAALGGAKGKGRIPWNKGKKVVKKDARNT
jgi:hypothetical protein